MRLAAPRWKWRLFWNQILNHHYWDRRLKWRFQHLWTHQVFSWFAWKERLSTKHQKMLLSGSEWIYYFVHTKKAMFLQHLFKYLFKYRMSLKKKFTFIAHALHIHNINITCMFVTLVSTWELSYFINFLQQKMNSDIKYKYFVFMRL